MDKLIKENETYHTRSKALYTDEDCNLEYWVTANSDPDGFTYEFEAKTGTFDIGKIIQLIRYYSGYTVDPLSFNIKIHKNATPKNVCNGITAGITRFIMSDMDDNTITIY